MKPKTRHKFQVMFQYCCKGVFLLLSIDFSKIPVPMDAGWYIYMMSRASVKGAYSVARHNCRMYSQLEFADAPLHW